MLLLSKVVISEVHTKSACFSFCCMFHMSSGTELPSKDWLMPRTFPSARKGGNRIVCAGSTLAYAILNIINMKKKQYERKYCFLFSNDKTIVSLSQKLKHHREKIPESSRLFLSHNLIHRFPS